MAIVVDASVVVAWALGEIHPTAALALTRIANEQPVVPALWRFEVYNGLVINERRGRIRDVRIAEFLQKLSEVDILVDTAPLEAQLITLARKHRLTVYDAAYLELALRRGLPLATLDRDLAAAARAEGVPLIGEAAG